MFAASLESQTSAWGGWSAEKNSVPNNRNLRGKGCRARVPTWSIRSRKSVYSSSLYVTQNLCLDLSHILPNQAVQAPAAWNIHDLKGTESCVGNVLLSLIQLLPKLSLSSIDYNPYMHESLTCTVQTHIHHMFAVYAWLILLLLHYGQSCARNN